MSLILAELARHLNARVRGDDGRRISAVASIDHAGPTDLVFAHDPSHLCKLDGLNAGAVLLRPADAEAYAGTALIVDNPHVAFARAALLLHPPRAPIPGIHPTAVIAADAVLAADVSVGAHVVVESGARLGPGAVLGAGCYIGPGAQLGARTRLMPNVTVMHACVLGDDCLIHAGAVIGSDGFGYARQSAQWVKVPQLGRVVLGHQVEIGANTTIDRGALDDTVIGDGVKIDNLVQVAHNVRIGENTAIAACVGIAGSAMIGKRCAFGGQVGVAGHVEITDDVQVMATSLVTNSIDTPGVYSSALKAEPVEQWRRNAVRVHQLEALAQRLKRIEEKLERLHQERNLEST
jgi:UDP-3-O-[3-hydroxymyristoyl] glucosamine N-acyltransferase